MISSFIGLVFLKANQKPEFVRNTPPSGLIKNTVRYDLLAQKLQLFLEIFQCDQSQARDFKTAPQCGKV